MIKSGLILLKCLKGNGVFKLVFPGSQIPSTYAVICEIQQKTTKKKQGVFKNPSKSNPMQNKSNNQKQIKNFLHFMDIQEDDLLYC